MRRTLERIYGRHRQGFYSLALTITRRPHMAEDAVQEAFARLWRSKARPTGDPVAYAYAAVRNAAIDLAAQPAAAGGGDVSMFNGRAPDPADHALDAEREQLIRDAIEALPDAQRQTLVLRIYGGLTFKQIAAACDEPLSTVASRYQRVLEDLKRKLADRL